MNMLPRDLALIILCCMIWGFAFIAGKAGADEFPPLLFTALRYGLLALVMFPFVRWHREQMGLLVATALTTGALYILFFYSGLALSDNVSLIAIAAQMEVPFTTLLAIMILGERIGWRRCLGFFFCVVGMVVLSFDPSAFEYSDGVLLILISALVGAAGTILMRHLREVNVFDLMAWTALMSFPFALMGTLIFESGQIATMAGASWAAWGGVAYGALVANLLAVGIFYYLMQHYEISLLATLTSLVPVFGVMFGVSLRGDLLTQQMLLGGIAILVGVVVIIEREKTRRRRLLRG